MILPFPVGPKDLAGPICMLTTSFKPHAQKPAGISLVCLDLVCLCHPLRPAPCCCLLCPKRRLLAAERMEMGGCREEAWMTGRGRNKAEREAQAKRGRNTDGRGNRPPRATSLREQESIWSFSSLVHTLVLLLAGWKMWKDAESLWTPVPYPVPPPVKLWRLNKLSRIWTC